MKPPLRNSIRVASAAADNSFRPDRPEIRKGWRFDAAKPLFFLPFISWTAGKR
jgi:hypothetical protein